LIVVDASITLAWCLGDERDALAERVLEQVVTDGAVAPAHWPLEVANGLWAAERRGRLDATDTERVRRLLADLDIEVVPVELSTATTAVLDAARSLGLSVYDAAYLDLARFRDVPIATLDDDLARACQESGVQLVS
jgi:predicted nucleic acid-binding protein